MLQGCAGRAQVTVPLSWGEGMRIRGGLHSVLPVVVVGSMNPELPDLHIFREKPESWIFMWSLLVF